MSFNSRLLEVITYYKMSPTTFGEKMDIAKSTMSRLINDLSNPSYPFLVSVKKQYPEINLNWLITGDGNMLIEEENDSIIKRLQNIISTLKNRGVSD